MARPAQRQGNLPTEATSFIGRKQELAELRKKLAAARLVSVVGPGGVGKSRFALRAASDLARSFADGAWWVELAEVRDAALVGSAVMAALDLRDQAGTEPLELLLNHLREKKVVVVLDNCEHLLTEIGRLAGEIIGAGPAVRLIATSREPLSIAGEQVLPLPPLELPSDEEPAAQLAQNEAVLLFNERAAAATGTFELTSGNARTVAEICRRLDGLPLAIELAAVRTRALSAQQILERLSDRFALLTGGSRAALPRHQTLRTTIDWSYRLLDADERAVFLRLCVFAGRFTLEDVEAVATQAEISARHALDVLASLVDKSLVFKEEAKGVAAYRLHETMREYARLKLQERGEEDAVEEALVQHYHRAALEGRPEARFRLLEWLTWLELEIDNIRAVLRRCVERRDLDRGIDITVGAAWYWITHATTEGLRWLEQFGYGHGSPDTEGWSYFLRGFLALLKAEPASAKPAFSQAAEYAREAAQIPLLSQALSMWSVVEMMSWDSDAARRLLDEATAVNAERRDVASSLGVFQAESLLGFGTGDLDGVRRASSEGLDLSKQANDLYAIEMLSTNLGLAAFMTGNLDEAKPRFLEALRITSQIDDRVALYYLLDLLGCHAIACRNPRLGAQLIGAAETVRTGAGARPIPILPALLAQAEQAGVAALGEAKFRAEVEAGKRLSREAAIGLAVGEPVPRAPIRADSNGPAGGELARRESDVAQLIAKGMSNKEIGAKLFISERTVDSHVRSILNKLGFNSRAQVAAWMAASR